MFALSYSESEDQSGAEESAVLHNHIKQPLYPQPHASDEHSSVLILPRNINAFKLGKLVDLDPMDVFRCVQEVATDIWTDEF